MSDNITETLVSLTVIKHGQTKDEYKVNFSMAAHICRVSLRLHTGEDPIDVAALLKKELIPIRKERQYPRLQTAHFRKPRYFIYRAVKTAATIKLRGWWKNFHQPLDFCHKLVHTNI